MTTPVIGLDLGGAYCAAIHQDRLVLAGSATISDLMLASTVGDHTDFRLATTTPRPARAAETGPPAVPALSERPALPVVDPARPPANPNDADDVLPFTPTPADGFWLQQTSSRQNTFHAIIQQEGMFLFGDLGEATVPTGAGQEAAFTAETVRIRENSWEGTEPGRTALIVAGLVVFIRKGGHDVLGIQWSEEGRKYEPSSLLVRAGNLFDRAVDMSYAPALDRRGDSIYVVGQSENVELNGQLGVMLMRQEAPAFAWARWRTEGRVIGGAAPLGHRVFLVERGGDQTDAVPGQIGLETLAPDGSDMLDAQVALAPVQTDVVNGLPYYTYAPLAAHASWMEGLTDLDRLQIYYVDNEGETLHCVTRQEILDRRGIVFNERQDDQPVLRVTDARVVEELTAYREVEARDSPQRPDTEMGEEAARVPVDTEQPLELWRITRWAPHAPQQLDPSQPLPPEGSIRASIGFSYERRVETLPYVARKTTGTSSRVRPFRMMDCNVDVVLPTGFEIPAPGEAARVEELVKAGEIEIVVTGSHRGRLRERPVRRPKARWLDTQRLVRVRSGPRSGYRDRLGIRVSSQRHVVLAGLSYRVVG